jgi:hypothetical protein
VVRAGLLGGKLEALTDRLGGGKVDDEGSVRGKAPELSGESDEELVPAIREAHTGDAVVEDAAVEITVNGRLCAAA